MVFSMWRKVYFRAVLFSCFLVFLSFCFSAGQVLAIGVGVRPSSLNLKVKTGQETTTEFLVINAGKEPAVYQVYPDSLEKEIKILNPDFRLEPQGSQIVGLKVNFKNPGRFAVNISVVARPLATTGLAAASGVKLPITVISLGWRTDWWIWAIIMSLVVCLIAVFTIKLILVRLNKIKPIKSE